MGGKGSGNRNARGKIGHRGGSGRPLKKVGAKTERFAGQRWTLEQMQRWTVFRMAHGMMSEKEFEELAFDLLCSSYGNDAID